MGVIVICNILDFTELDLGHCDCSEVPCSQQTEGCAHRLVNQPQVQLGNNRLNVLLERRDVQERNEFTQRTQLEAMTRITRAPAMTEVDRARYTAEHAHQRCWPQMKRCVQ